MIPYAPSKTEMIRPICVVAVTLIYGMVMLLLNGFRKVDGPYPFFRVHHQSASATVMWICVLFAVITGLSILVWVAAR